MFMNFTSLYIKRLCTHVYFVEAVSLNDHVYTFKVVVNEEVNIKIGLNYVFLHAAYIQIVLQLFTL